MQITDYALGYVRSAALRTVALGRVADHLADGPLGIEDLAIATDMNAPLLLRVLRLLAGDGIFQEVGDGVFALTEQADLLRTDAPDSIRAGLVMLTDETFWLPAARLADTVRTGSTVFSDIFGSPFFDFLRQTGGAADFHLSMAALSGGENDAVAAALPIPPGTVVDVGGGRGGLLAAILLRHANVVGVLFDRDEAIANHELNRPELLERSRTQAGDFFDAVPPAASYVLKRILHDWNDDDCVQLLTTIRAAIPDTGRVFVVDGIMPDDNRPHPLRTFDVLMMSSFDGRERHEHEFRTLLDRAGFTCVRIIPTEWTMTIIDAQPTPETLDSAQPNLDDSEAGEADQHGPRP